MSMHRTCDGVTRRDLLKIGAFGATGLTLASYLRLADAGEAREARGKSAIFINLQGGPSHMDTFDLKPDAPAEYRGLFNPIKTNVEGVEISEHLPKLAQVADKFAILRGVTHTLGAHQLGTEYVNTGNRPTPAVEYPGYAAVATKELGGPVDLPTAVSIPRGRQRSGFLGVKYAPLETGSTPRAGQPYQIRGFEVGGGLTLDQVKHRQGLLEDLDKTFHGYEADNQLLAGLDRFDEQAYSIITSKRSREAFDISKESTSFAKPFGEDGFGVSALLALRLVESGVRFVTLSLGGWDTHRDNFPKLKDNLLPTLDTGLSALLVGLDQRGLLDSTVVYVTGEFGRTPKINNRSNPGGRDHYPRCMFMLLAGGGIRGGQVVGESDAKATLPKGEGYSPNDVAATFYHALGIDPTKEYHTSTGRPIMIVRDGKVIRSLFG